MDKGIKQQQRLYLIFLVVFCVGIILIGGLRYVRGLRDSLAESAVQDVMNVTKQQQQAFDSFCSSDQERLHRYAEFFAQTSLKSPENVRTLLAMITGGDAACMVMCFDDGWACSSTYDGVLRVSEEQLEIYGSLPDSGVRDSFVGMISGLTKFSYYEAFTFSDGKRGLIEKAYNRSALLETFALSLYDGQGFGYILDQNGDILLRSTAMTSDRVYDNVFDALIDTHSPQKDIDAFAAAMEAKETGSITFDGDGGRYVYTYVPLESVDGWYLLSIVPVEAIRAEGDAILRNTRTMLWFLVLILMICAVFILLIWRTEREIQEKERSVRYQSQLFDIFTTYLSRNTDDMYMMFDHETEALEYVSPNVERVLGVKAEELKDYFWESDLSADPEGTREYYAGVQALAPGQTAAPRNTERINPKTGERKYFLENAYCADIQGRSKRVAYISDRTKERKAQDSLAEALRMAQAANEAKSAFLSSVSHDIRTPMNAIIGFLALMQNEADNPGLVREYAQRIDAASQHLLGLINDVLDMNKIESGSTTLSISEMNLAEVIDEINTIIRPQAKAKSQTFHIFVSQLTYEHLMGDKMRINQVLINLLSNAVKYTQENGTIEMRVEELSQVVNNYSRVRFTVRDNGFGMSEDYLKVIFDPFTREETKVTHEIQGTGLGMAITKSLVDLMGGDIRVESKPGKGSTFTVELELRIQEAAVREDDPGFWNEHSLTRMIVADDDEQICRNIARTMAKTGVSTDFATNGETAVQMILSAREEGRPYDLILLDWQMPTLNGLETARLIRKKYREKIPILLFTAYDWSDIEQEAMEIGVNHFMPKPFFMSTFKEAIRRVMGSTEKKAETQPDVVRGRHILVVDDIEVNRIILVKILKSMGAVCETAVNGREAVEKFEAASPGEYDLILMDVQMPLMNGYEATRAIRSSGHPQAKEIPIIAMTANAFVDDVRDAIESGMDAHIAKPVQIDNLKATIQQVLENRSA
ncbi:MAG: response regulator [Oscillospiraceae bacterium]|nr:response regulator [Oscillospiraceae bacterium]